ncbi:MAG: hypothetical protein GYA26_08680 [Flexilinea flocculi]|nr:hypothetical protein [Flexilinea flocculi]
MEEKQITRNNQEICPNCLEPNNDDLANCAFCGMPLHGNPGVVELPSDHEDGNTNSEISSDPSASIQGSVEPADSPKGKSKKDDKINRGFTYAMRGMGLYLVVYSITELPRSLKLENPQDRKLAAFGDIIYLVAGCLMAWPLLKDYLDKRKQKQESTLTQKTIEPIQNTPDAEISVVQNTSDSMEQSADESVSNEQEESVKTSESTEDTEKKEE